MPETRRCPVCKVSVVVGPGNTCPLGHPLDDVTAEQPPSASSAGLPPELPAEPPSDLSAGLPPELSAPIEVEQGKSSQSLVSSFDEIQPAVAEHHHRHKHRHKPTPKPGGKTVPAGLAARIALAALLAVAAVVLGWMFISDLLDVTTSKTTATPGASANATQTASGESDVQAAAGSGTESSAEQASSESAAQDSGDPYTTEPGVVIETLPGALGTIPDKDMPAPSPGGGIPSIGLMLPTVSPGDQMDFVSYGGPNGHPVVGDIVLVQATKSIFGGIRRVVGEPGDTVQIVKGYVVLNGEKLDEPYVELVDKSFGAGPFETPKGAVFVIGDNRTILDKYRGSWGFVDARLVTAKVTVR